MPTRPREGFNSPVRGWTEDERPGRAATGDSTGGKPSAATSTELRRREFQNRAVRAWSPDGDAGVAGGAAVVRLSSHATAEDRAARSTQPRLETLPLVRPRIPWILPSITA